ncbi:Metal dependent phosphohydrolase, HD region [Verrucomicrobia bacterium]|nr:Metal dependent phosphohydrolase, HD region [Verrucomicrobiota bacterium]
MGEDPRTDSSLLEEAIEIAVEAHRGQLDRAGQPYILHPLRVMCRMQTPAEKMVAILHDVVEDTDWTLDALRKRGFPEEIVQAVDCLTKREGEPYQALIDRAKQNPLARRVKLGDLEDNMDVRRNANLTEKDLERLNKYRNAWEELSEASC